MREWKKGMIVGEESENVKQLAFFEAVIVFLKSIFLRAYFSCMLFGLLLQSPCALMHENKSSMWSCGNL